MNPFLTLLRRRGVLFGLMAVLLTAVIAFETIAVAALLNVSVQINSVSDRYTTVAIPKVDALWTKALLLDGDGTKSSLLQQQTAFPGLLSEDRRAFLAAHVSGCEGVSAYERGFSDEAANAYDAYSRSLSVYAARCDAVSEDIGEAIRVIFDENSEPVGEETIKTRTFHAQFSLLSVVCQFPAYETALPPVTEISFSSNLYPGDGALPFEAGKTYLLFGSAVPTNQTTVGHTETGEPIVDFMAPGLRSLRPGYEEAVYDNSGDIFGDGHDPLFSWEGVFSDTGTWYQRANVDALPYSAQYDGMVEAFLDSDAGSVWRETILPLCRTNYESAGVILTDALDSVLWFNTGEASILEGRSFEPQDYANGENVCLVSAAYALKNGITLGQTLSLELYRSALGERVILEGDQSVAQRPVTIREPCKKENAIGVRKDYTVVGIYTAPEFSSGQTSFFADTIFLPKASVPGAQRYERVDHRLLYSLILENGKAGEFEAALAERGCGNLFAYFDQDYNVLAETLDVMHGNALRMVLIGGALFVLAAALFFFLFLRQTADAARKLRLLGVRGGLVRKQRYAAAVVLIVLAAALGAAGSIVLYGTVTQQVLSASIALEPPVLLLCAAAQTLLLLLTALACTLTTARQNLMQKR